jgi:hypothetical protein
MWGLFANQFGGIHPEGLSEHADRAPLGFLRYVAGDGEPYMGLFPRTVGKRFSRARTGASWGTHPWPRLPGRGKGRKADARVGSYRTLHLYPAPQHVVLTGIPFTGSRRPASPHRAWFMRDPASELRRITLPRTPVNRGEKKGRGCYAPALLTSLRSPRAARHQYGQTACTRSSTIPRYALAGSSR